MRRVALRDQRPALRQPPERPEIGVAEPVCHLGDFHERVVRGLRVSAFQGLQRHGDTQVSLLHAVQRRVLEQVLRLSQPASTTSVLTALDEREPEPERAPYRGRRLAAVQERVCVRSQASLAASMCPVRYAALASRSRSSAPSDSCWSAATGARTRPATPAGRTLRGLA